MNASRSIATAVAALAAFFALSAVSGAATTKPAAMTKAEYRALSIRSHELNRQYGNAATGLTARQFAALYAAGAGRLAPQELIALVARSVALNRMYGLGG